MTLKELCKIYCTLGSKKCVAEKCDDCVLQNTMIMLDGKHYTVCYVISRMIREDRKNAKRYFD